MIGLVASVLLLAASPVRAEEPVEEPAVEAAPMRVRTFPHADPTCPVCHSAVPEAGSAPEASNLRMPPEQACAMCHLGEIHHGVREHLGRVVQAPLPEGIALLEGGKVACFSCHDVHQVATDPEVVRRIEAAGERPLVQALRARALDREWSDLASSELTWPVSGDPRVLPLLALPVDDGSLCRACHGEGP